MNNNAKVLLPFGICMLLGCNKLPEAEHVGISRQPSPHINDVAYSNPEIEVEYAGTGFYFWLFADFSG